MLSDHNPIETTSILTYKSIKHSHNNDCIYKYMLIKKDLLINSLTSQFEVTRRMLQCQGHYQKSTGLYIDVEQFTRSPLCSTAADSTFPQQHKMINSLPFSCPQCSVFIHNLTQQELTTYRSAILLYSKDTHFIY